MDEKTRNSNLYTLFYACALVIVVAALLAIASQGLKSRQDQNVLLEKQSYILQSIRLDADVTYTQYITDSLLTSPNGTSLPIYIGHLDDGSTKYIIPLDGTGLWGPIWGYLALNEDLNTIYGAVFDHKSETPGLGAEISKPSFSNPFRGKMLFKEGAFVSLQVLKGHRSQDNPHAVDAVSGGTITSGGVEKMLRESLTPYLPFFDVLKKEAAHE